MVDEVIINVEIKPSYQIIPLTLYLKIYSKNNKLIYLWRTDRNSEYFVEIIQHDRNYVYERDINKDLRIISPKENIAEQMIEKIPVFE